MRKHRLIKVAHIVSTVHGNIPLDHRGACRIAYGFALANLRRVMTMDRQSRKVGGYGRTRVAVTPWRIIGQGY